MRAGAVCRCATSSALRLPTFSHLLIVNKLRSPPQWAARPTSFSPFSLFLSISVYLSADHNRISFIVFCAQRSLPYVCMGCTDTTCNTRTHCLHAHGHVCCVHACTWPCVFADMHAGSNYAHVHAFAVVHSHCIRMHTCNHQCTQHAGCMLMRLYLHTHSSLMHKADCKYAGVNAHLHASVHPYVCVHASEPTGRASAHTAYCCE